MIRINRTPYPTSKNYGINDIEIDEKIFDKKIEQFDGFEIKNTSEIKFLDVFAEKKQDKSNFLAQNIEQKCNCSKTLEIQSNTQEPLQLCFVFDKKNQNLVEKTYIKVLPGVDAQVVLKFVGDFESLHNGQINLICEENSKVEFVALFDMGKGSNNFVSFSVSAKENSEVEFYIADFSGENSIQRFQSQLLGDNARCDLNVMYLADKKSVLDLNLYQQIFGKSCKAIIESVGALDGEARKNFKGTISFEKGCKKSCGEESEFCMMLSDAAKSKALPMLLCGEEDVEGTHSTAIGRIDEKQLFYIMSRGLSYEEALKLVVKAKYNVFVSKLFDEDLKKEILEKIDRKFEYEEN